MGLLPFQVCGAGVIRFEHLAVLQNIQEGPSMNNFIILYSQLFTVKVLKSWKQGAKHLLNYPPLDPLWLWIKPTQVWRERKTLSQCLWDMKWVIFLPGNVSQEKLLWYDVIFTVSSQCTVLNFILKVWNILWKENFFFSMHSDPVTSKLYKFFLFQLRYCGYSDYILSNWCSNCYDKHTVYSERKSREEWVSIVPLNWPPADVWSWKGCCWFVVSNSDGPVNVCGNWSWKLFYIAYCIRSKSPYLCYIS